jgi:hypothetical protein
MRTIDQVNHFEKYEMKASPIITGEKKSNAELLNSKAIDSEKITKTLIELLKIFSTFEFSLESLEDDLIIIRDAKKTYDKISALISAEDNVACNKSEASKLACVFKKNQTTDNIADSLKEVLSSEAVETIVELKKRGKFND